MTNSSRPMAWSLVGLNCVCLGNFENRRSAILIVADQTVYAKGVPGTVLRRLKASDIGSQCMVLHIQQGKGARNRDVPLSPKLLAILREHWRWMKPKTYLSPSMENNWRRAVRFRTYHRQNRNIRGHCDDLCHLGWANVAGCRQPGD